MTFNMELIFKEKGDAVMAHSLITSEFTYGELFSLPDFSYAYPIKQEGVAILEYLSKLRGIAPEGFIPYLRQMSGDMIQVMKNRNPERVGGELAVMRDISEVYCVIEHTSERPEPVAVETAAAAWKFDLNLTIEFMRPDRLSICYPPMLGNNPVPAALIPEQYWRLAAQANLRMYSNRFVDAWVRGEYTEPPPRPWQCPSYDNWAVDEVDFSEPAFRGYRPILTVLWAQDDVDNPDRVSRLNLLDNYGSGDTAWYLPQAVVEVLTAKREKCLIPGEQVWVVVYSGGVRLNQVQLQFTLDSDGAWVGLPARPLNHVHRLVVFAKP
jgi:hypothetical protein